MSVLTGAANQRHQSRYFAGIGKGGLKLFVLPLLRIERIQGGSNIVAPAIFSSDPSQDRLSYSGDVLSVTYPIYLRYCKKMLF
jgi:hypothetical protein